MVLFTARGNQRRWWREAKVCIPAGVYRLAFVATVGLVSLSDIAVDNVAVEQDEQKCGDGDSSSSSGAAF